MNYEFQIQYRSLKGVQETAPQFVPGGPPHPSRSDRDTLSPKGARAVNSN
jgi:hypothetical protein